MANSRKESPGIRIASILDRIENVPSELSERERTFRSSEFMATHLASPCFLTSLTFAHQVTSFTWKRDLGLALTPVRALTVLSKTDEPISSTQIMQAIGQPSDPGTRVVRCLEEKGFIRRIGSETDRRVMDICITQKGRDSLDVAMTDLHARFKEFTDLLDPREVNLYGIESKDEFDEEIDSLLSSSFIGRIIDLYETAQNAIERTSVTLTQYRILTTIRILEGRAPASELKRYLFLKANTLSSALAKLEQAGLIRRVQGDDMRQIDVIITANGSELVEQVGPIMYDAMMDYYLSHDEDYETVHGFVYANCIITLNVLADHEVTL